MQRLPIHLFADLETAGTHENAKILSVALYPININLKELPGIEVVIDPQRSGGDMDPGTIAWWTRQAPAARARVFNNPAAVSECEAVEKLDRYMRNYYDDFRIWGNGATFDIMKITRMFERCGKRTPWKFYNERDVRTVVELGELANCDIKSSLPFDGVQHVALDDARHQARYTMFTIQALLKGSRNV